MRGEPRPVLSRGSRRRPIIGSPDLANAWDSDMEPIDIVIPHVDGSAPGYEELVRRHTGEFVPCQLRDLGELRHVLRSIEANAPWAEIVVVVQSPAHLPTWLDRDTVRVVLHDDFIPRDLLPTFHWATIVAHLHRIPRLRERYVVWEDDVVAGRSLSPADFFDDGGLLRPGWEEAPIIRGLGRFLGTYQRNLEATDRALVRVLGRETASFLWPHAPLPATRASWGRFFDAFCADEIFRDTVTRRSRGDERNRPTVDPTVLYANWVEVALRGRSTASRLGGMAGRALRALGAGLVGPGRTPHHAKYAVVNDFARMSRHMRRLSRNRALFANVNDEAYDRWDGNGDINPASVALLNQTLSNLLPGASRYEIRADTARALVPERDAIEGPAEISPPEGAH
jgi:hypothetical protein